MTADIKITKEEIVKLLGPQFQFKLTIIKSKLQAWALENNHYITICTFSNGDMWLSLKEKTNGTRKEKKIQIIRRGRKPQHLNRLHIGTTRYTEVHAQKTI